MVTCTFEFVECHNRHYWGERAFAAAHAMKLHVHTNTAAASEWHQTKSPPFRDLCVWGVGGKHWRRFAFHKKVFLTFHHQPVDEKTLCVCICVCARRKYDGEMRIKFCINILFARQDDRFGDIRKHVDDEPGRIRTWLAGDVSLSVHQQYQQQQYHASDREKTCHDCVDRRSEPKKRMDGYRRFSSTQDESSMLFVVFRCTSC